MMRTPATYFASLGAGAFLMNALFGLLTLVATAFGAHAQERVVFVAKIPPIDSWCGDHAVIFDSRRGLTWLDVFDKRRISLRVTKSDVWLLACSPNSRWVLVREGPMGGEGGDPGCNPRDKISFPRVLLWDTKTMTSYVIGTGFFSFAWSADGKTLLYRPRPYCDLEMHPRTYLRWPAGLRAFQPISVRALIAQALDGGSGWIDNGRIGAVGWIDSDRFVVQIPDGEGNALWDVTPDGAIVMIQLADGRIRQAAQLHPSVTFASGDKFQTTRKFDIPQLAEKASDDILHAATCEMIGPGMSCGSDFGRELEHVRPNMARYCAALTEKNPELCAPVAAGRYWERLRRGRTVLLLKPPPDAAQSLYRLFRIDHDQEGYLK
jgi:hypothetical protein